MIAEELVRIDDERLAFVTITASTSTTSSTGQSSTSTRSSGEEGDAAVRDVLDGHRRRIQSSINRQIRAKKTPVLDFRPDEVIRAAERIEDILRADRPREG